ncbi:Intracellular distribution of mitochondria [Maudiozyma exigua]|uniref:Intracellular distribution of mitochondria n=1 Tax=Maudiozyma exigua TaxID=34358 RepID=A0A9P6W2Y9_MAUEX|nr:Intracellular distribution of mitochondria [Kazachstania exigua]
MSAPEPNVNIKVNIKLPNVHAHHGKKTQTQDKLSLQFNKDSKVQTVLDVLTVAKQTKFLTNIQLKHNDTILNDEQVLSELTTEKSIEKDIPVDIAVELKPYTYRESLRHAVVVRDLVGFSSETDDTLSEFAVSTGSKIESLNLKEIRQKDPEAEKKKEEAAAAKKAAAPGGSEEEKSGHFFDITDDEKEATAKMIREIFKSEKGSSIKQFFTTNPSLITPCVRSLNLSQYNPVPAFYKTKGHLLYLQVVTLEGESLHITGTPSGFYVNKSSNSKFDPSLKVKAEDDLDSKKHGHKHESHSGETTFYNLYDLLAAHSKNFTSHIEKMEAKLATLESAAYVKPQTAYLHKPWLISNVPSNSGDYSNLQQNYINNIVNLERNFNDEFQAIKDLPIVTIFSRIESERLLAKLIHEFSGAATEGAILIMQNSMVAMNPEANESEQIFLKDNIFYSYVTDIMGTYSDKGGDEAARVASNQDLLTISILNRINLKDVRYLLTTVVDFGGKRLLAQTPVPGLLGTMGSEVIKDETTGEETLKDMENDIIVSYGYDETTKERVHDTAFDNILGKEFAKVFHLKKADDKDVWFSSQSKGIVGTDKRHYILDLANTYPVDICFVREHYEGVDEESRYPHRQTLLRPELIEKWWNQKVDNEKDLSVTEAWEDGKFTYNVDAYQVDGVEDKTVDEISNFLNNEIINGLIENISEGNVTVPYSGSHLIDTLHLNGINVRYLGKIIEVAKAMLTEQEKKHDDRLKEIVESNSEYEAWEAAYLEKIQKMIKDRQEQINKYVQEGKEVPQELKEGLKLDESEVRKVTKSDPVLVGNDELLPVIGMAYMEIISRSMKHILRSYAKELPIPGISSMVAYFFNLLFGNNYNSSPKAEQIDDFYPVSDYKFSSVTREILLETIIKQAKLRFRIDITPEELEKYLSYKILMIKEICTKFGVQLINKNYFFTPEEFEEFKQAQDKKIRSKLIQPTATFAKDDMIIIPLVKTSKYNSILSEELWNQGTGLVAEEKTEQGLTLMAQSLAVLEDVKGVVHSEVASKYLSMATVHSRIGLLPEAIAFCRKACTIYERTDGFDSFESIRAMNNLALLELSNESPLNAASIYNRIIEISTIFDLEKFHHPITTTVFGNLEQLALGTANMKLTTEVLTHLAEIIVKLDGKDAVAYGFTESRLGNLCASNKEYQAALDHIVEAEKVFTKELGSNDHLTASAKKWINSLVNLMNDLRQQKMMQKSQNAADNSPVIQPGKKSHGKKQNVPDPKLAEKSVDELLDFIEGDEPKKSGKNAKGKKKNNKK